VVPVWGPAGIARRRSLAASSAAIVLIGTLPAAGAGGKASAAKAASLAGQAARTDAFFMNVVKPDQPYSPAECQSQFEITCYTPTQIQRAYSLPQLYAKGITGKGTTVVVVDAYGSPTLAADLGEFDSEATEPTSSGYYDHPETQYAATDPDVVAVGGTTLDLGSGGSKLAADTVWNNTYSQAVNVGFNLSTVPSPIATGGGYSTVFVRPSYQHGVRNVVGRWRGIPDISVSASSAELSAKHAKGIVLVTSGNNTVAYNPRSTGAYTGATAVPTVTVHDYYARHGYRLAAGVGTIDARVFLPELVSPGSVKPPRHTKVPDKGKHKKKQHAR
jgi:hypothetical protein